MAEVKKVKKAVPKPMTEDEKAEICKEYLGVHPKYFKYAGQSIRVDIFQHQRDGYNWRGWKQEELAQGKEWKDKWIERENQ